jgi:hypothetical protein
MTRAGRRARSGGVAALAGSVILWGAVLSPSALAAAADQPSAGTASLDTVVIPSPGPGYAVTSQGPLNSEQFTSRAPDPSAAARALSTLTRSMSTYERVWQADDGPNQVQDLLVRFPDDVGAQAFLQAAQRSLESGEIVSSDAMPSIPAARRVTYFAATNQDGVGEAVTMRAGVYVDLLSFFSAASAKGRPISPAKTEHVAQDQYAAMVQAPGGAHPKPAPPTAASTKSVSAGTILFAVLVVAVLALAVATPALLRRRRDTSTTEGGATGPRAHEPSGNGAVDDLREQRG